LSFDSFLVLHHGYHYLNSCVDNNWIANLVYR
jgi:hypothetical protein